MESILRFRMKKGIILLFLIAGLYTFAASSQKIDLQVKSIMIDGQVLQVEIADSPEAHRIGLMHRESMSKDRGMLFIFSKPNYLSFWMKNTKIPLDIGFFDENRELVEYYSMKPYDLRTTDSSKKVKYALEVNQGWFRQNKIKIGSKFKFLSE